MSKHIVEMYRVYRSNFQPHWDRDKELQNNSGFWAVFVPTSSFNNNIVMDPKL